MTQLLLQPPKDMVQYDSYCNTWLDDSDVLASVSTFQCVFAL